MIKIIIIGILAYCSSSYSDCTDESKDLDRCLECCTDTAFASNFIKQHPEIIKDLEMACGKRNSNSHVQAIGEGSKEIYKKYKIDSSVVFTLCEQQNGRLESKPKSEFYKNCVSRCKEKFEKGRSK